jgi:subtilisin family serine protease
MLTQLLHFHSALQIIDTGVDEDYFSSSQLKLVGGANFIGGSSKGAYSWNDCNGHGTHVAGTGMFSRLDAVTVKQPGIEGS